MYDDDEVCFCGASLVDHPPLYYRMLNRYGDEVGDADGDTVAEATRSAEADGWVVLDHDDDRRTLTVTPDK